MGQLWTDLIKWLMSLTMQDWFLLFVCIVILGASWLRGYGSRSEY